MYIIFTFVFLHSDISLICYRVTYLPMSRQTIDNCDVIRDSNGLNSTGTRKGKYVKGFFYFIHTYSQLSQINTLSFVPNKLCM
jgi:hypothetical protein